MVAHRSKPSGGKPQGQAASAAGGPERHGERIARALARAGVASRREAERLIAEGRVSLNGVVLTSPAVNVTDADILLLDGVATPKRERTRLWLHHKPRGLVTTHSDPKGRPTVFEALPKDLGRVISVGRLDLTSEGLLLLTNDGDLARKMELPSGGFVRSYRARAFGRIAQERLDALTNGLTVDGVAYGPIKATLERGEGANVWIALSLAEGKNREVRKVLDALGLKVNRLIRIAYGPFELGALAVGAVQEAPSALVERLGRGGEVKTFIGQATEEPKGRGPRARGLQAKPKRRPEETVTEEKKVYKAGWAKPRVGGLKASKPKS